MYYLNFIFKYFIIIFSYFYWQEDKNNIIIIIIIYVKKYGSTRNLIDLVTWSAQPIYNPFRTIQIWLESKWVKLEPDWLDLFIGLTPIHSWESSGVQQNLTTFS